MSKEKNKDRHCLYLEISYSCNGKEYDEIKVYHFITKVTENRLNVYGGKLCRLSLQRQLAHP